MTFDADRLVRVLQRMRETLGSTPDGVRPDPDGLTERQRRTLGLLDEQEPVMVGELAEHLGVTPSTMSLNLGRLERLDLIRRRRDPADRRVMNVTLTGSGARARDRTPGLVVGRADAILSTLRPEERRTVLEGLALLHDALDRAHAREQEYLRHLAGGTPAETTEGATS